VRGEDGTVIAAAARALAEPRGWSPPALAFAAGSLALVLAGNECTVSSRAC